ncbi:MAG: Fe-only nitrogenase accessory AnfO family protein [Lachnotalea sp.]
MIKIGVILNQEDKISSLVDGTYVAIYEKNESGWAKTYEVKECFTQRDSINEMREFLKKLIVELEDCKILIGSILTGIPFMILDKAGFMLCEAEELSERLFEEIAMDYEQILLQKQDETKPTFDYPTAPFETKEKGIFELDMKKLHESHPEVSSKMALIPFLKAGKFYKLIVYCNHVMPWFDRELPILDLEYQVNMLEGQGYQVEIEKKCCE